MRGKLTKSIVVEALPQGKPYQIHDTELHGLLLRVEPSGSRSYYLEYRNADGRRLRYRIGGYPGLEPDQARKLAKIAAGDVASGIDIQARKKEQRNDHELARRQTLRVFGNEQYEPWALAHLKSAVPLMERLRADFGAWLDKPMGSLNRWLIEGWRKKELGRGVCAVAVNRSVQRLQGALSKAVEWGVIEIHPFAGLKPLRTDRRGRVRFLSADERRLRDALIASETDLREARDRFNEWRVIRHKAPLPVRDAEFVDYIRPAVLLAMNTGPRRGELLGLKWSDIDLSAKLLTVVSTNSKNGQTRRIPLNREAADVLERWRAQHGSDAAERYVFAAQKGERILRIDVAWRTLRELGVSPQLAYWYANNGWLERLGRGVFVRDSKQLDLQASLRALELLGKSFHVGGRAALSSQGVRHFLRHDEPVTLYGTDPLILPEWLTSRFNVVYRRRRLFKGRGSDSLGVKRLDGQPRSPLVAEPERAILEHLSEVPQRASLEEAKRLMEGLQTMRTDLLQRLLGQCMSVKTVRLFLTLSRELNLPHMATLREKGLRKGNSASRYVYRGRGETLVLKA